MATKVTGLGDNYYVGGYDLSGATNALNKISGTIGQIDVTDITQSGHHRLNGIRDGVIEWTSLFDTSASGAHTALSALPTSDVITTYFRGTAVGNPAASLNSKQVNYDPTRTNTGEITFAVQAVGQGYGIEWGTQLTAGIRTDTAATTGTFYDLTGFYPAPVTFPISFGAQAYLQVFSFTGTDATVKIQHCATSGGVYSDLIAFTQITSTTPQAQRVTVSNTTTVNEFIKITTITTGGFTSLKFAVMMNVNLTSGVIF